MRPNNLTTKIFLDSGDPIETKNIIELLGFLDGQTTNPTLITKHPYARERFENGERFTETEIYDFYKGVVSEISAKIPNGSVSIEVYADANTTANDMFTQAQQMNTWIPNAHIKYPVIPAGLESAQRSIAAGIRVNMTLCFTEQQAAAVYAATSGAKKGDVFISPFVGRLDDRGQNGMSLISNINELYKTSDHHVEMLAASVRTMAHFMQSLALGVDCITAPYTVLEEWGKAGMPIPHDDFVYDSSQLIDIPFKNIELTKQWSDYDIQHDLTDVGLARFVSDWNQILK